MLVPKAIDADDVDDEDEDSSDSDDDEASQLSLAPVNPWVLASNAVRVSWTCCPLKQLALHRLQSPTVSRMMRQR